MAQQTIVAQFDSRGEAETAVEALVRAGIARTSITTLPDAGSATTYERKSTTTGYDRDKDEGGFWSSLGNLFVPDDDRQVYAEGMSRGGVTISVTADGEAQAAEAMDVMERHGAVDLDEREQSYRSSGYLTGAAATGVAATTTTTTTTTTGRGATGMAAADLRDDEAAIPIIEERLRVGKRQVAGGRVRARSYMVETPVEEQVTLRSERVHVERRAVDRAVGAGELSAFQERTIELDERSEEAVVSKEARVVEEVTLGKEASDRVETVRDSVRRTEVEVDDARADRGTVATNETTVTRDVETDLGSRR